MFRVKCKVADWCEGNDRGYYRKPKEFIYTNKFETEKEAQEFMEKERAKHTPPQRRTSIYSDYEVIKDLDESFDVYKKDQKYNIIYADKDGKDNEFKFTPEEDMSKPEMIMKCKEANKNFVKLKEIKKLEEGVRKMEETKKFETLADIIEDRYEKGLEGLDVGDNTIDMIVYFDYNPEDVTNSADTYSKCLDTIATGTKVVNYDEEGAYAVVDFYNYVIDHLNAFTNNFTINIDPADGEDNETIAANIVEGILPGLISGYTDDHTYNSLDTDLLMGVQKKEEGIFHKEYVVHGSIGGSQGYIGNDIEKGEDNLYKNADDGKKFDSEKEAREAAKRIETEFNANEVSVLPLKKALKYDKKEESFEDSKKFMAGEILAIIDRYIHTSDLENLFKDMDIDQSIYEGDKEIPEGKIQDIVEVGLQWLFDHLQPEDYKRVLKNELEMTDEEMEKYGVELEESKKIQESNELPITKSFATREEAEQYAEDNHIQTCEFHEFKTGVVLIYDPNRSENQKDYTEEQGEKERQEWLNKVNKESGLKESKKIEEDNENTFKPEVNNKYFLNNNLIWDERIGDLAIGIGASQLESIKEAEDQSGVTVDENIKKYLEEHPANLFIVEGQIPDIKVTLLGDQSGNPVKIDNLRVGG